MPYIIPKQKDCYVDESTHLYPLPKHIKPKSPVFFINPYIPLSRERWTKHMMIMGAVGGGKTTTMLFLLEQIIKFKDKLFLLDIKCDFTAYFKRAMIIGFSDERSYVWDVAKDIKTEEEAEVFAEKIIPDSDDPMWANASRMVLSALIVKLQKTMKTSWIWGDLARAGQITPDELKVVFKEYYPKGLNIVEGGGDTTASILVNFTAFMQVINTLAKAWDEKPREKYISIKDWLFDDNSKVRQLILQGDMSYEPVTKALGALLTGFISNQIISGKFGESKSRRFWFILDEFPAIGKISIDQLIAIGRSKGVRVILGFQDLDQLKNVYSNEIANAWMAMMGTHLIVKINGGESSKWVSENLFGYRKVNMETVSRSESQGQISKSFQGSPDNIMVMSPASLVRKLGLRKDKKGINVAMIGFDNPAVITVPFIDLKKVRRGYVAAQWTLGLTEFEKHMNDLGFDDSIFNDPCMMQDMDMDMDMSMEVDEYGNPIENDEPNQESQTYQEGYFDLTSHKIMTLDELYTKSLERFKEEVIH